MSLSDKKSYHSKDGMDVRACMCNFWYKEEDVQEALNKTLMDLDKLSKKKDEGYEEFERGYKVACNQLLVIVRSNFGDALVATGEGGSK